MATSGIYKNETEDLELHVSICHERYIQLDSKMAKIEADVEEIKKDVVEGQKSLKKTIISTAGAIIVAILGLCGTIFTVFVDKLH